MSTDEYAIAFERERRARRRAERIIEEKNRDIYHLRRDLMEARAQLQSQQETLLQADKLKSVGQLASGITHEINNPLAFITSNLHLLDDYFSTLVDTIQRVRAGRTMSFSDAEEKELDTIVEDVPEIFEEAGEGLERIGKIVSNVKRFARKNAQERQLADINQEVMASLRLVEKQLNANTHVDIGLGQLPLVSCNVSEIGQVMINLIMNADQAIPAEGGIIRLGSSVEGKCVVLTVADTGCGIPDEEIENIFDPFFTTKPVGEGTGLGLSVSYGIVDAHGGSISVASELGKGTTFTLVLPID